MANTTILDYQIPQDLIYNQHYFPENSLLEAIENKEVSADLLLEHMEYAFLNYDELNQGINYFGLIHATYLLAEFRDQRAFPILIKWLTFAPEKLEDSFCGEFYESIESLLASVYNGDFEVLSHFIENNQIDEEYRGAVLRSLIVLVQEGLLERTFVVDYLTRLIDKELIYSMDTPYKGGWLFIDFLSVISLLKVDELRLRVKESLTDDFFDPSIHNLEMIHKLFYQDHKDLQMELERLKSISNAVESLKNDFDFFYQPHEELLFLIKTFLEKYEEALYYDQEDDELEEDEEEYDENFLFTSNSYKNISSAPHVKTSPKVGRNDPCLCGSGKKYKKCCSS